MGRHAASSGVGPDLGAHRTGAGEAGKPQGQAQTMPPFIPFIIGFPAGLVVYWITTNIWTIGQQFAVNKFIPVPDIPTPAEVAAVKAPPPPPKKKKRRR